MEVKYYRFQFYAWDNGAWRERYIQSFKSTALAFLEKKETGLKMKFLGTEIYNI